MISCETRARVRRSRCLHDAGVQPDVRARGHRAGQPRHVGGPPQSSSTGARSSSVRVIRSIDCPRSKSARIASKILWVRAPVEVLGADQVDDGRQVWIDAHRPDRGDVRLVVVRVNRALRPPRSMALLGMVLPTAGGFPYCASAGHCPGGAAGAGAAHGWLALRLQLPASPSRGAGFAGLAGAPVARLSTMSFTTASSLSRARCAP